MELALHLSTEMKSQIEGFVSLAERSFDENVDRMTVQQFMKVSEFDIDPVFVDEQWAMVNSPDRNTLVELTPEMCKRLEIGTPSRLLTKLVKLFPGCDGASGDYSGDGHNVMIQVMEPVRSDEKRKKKRTVQKKVFVTREAYEELLMATRSPVGRKVRKSYIALEELSRQYLLYQQAFQIVSARRAEEVLLNQNDQLRAILQNKKDQVFEQSSSAIKDLTMAMTGGREIPPQRTGQKWELVILQDRNDPKILEVVWG